MEPKKLNRHYRDQPLLKVAPLVYLGDAGELTVFNRRVPLMLSIPLSALPGSAQEEFAKMAIPHEVAHAIFAQVPEVIDEIKEKLRHDLLTGAIASGSELELSQRDSVLYHMAIDWTEEICADLVGTALAGEQFA